MHCLLLYSDGEDFNSTTDIVNFAPGNQTSDVFVPLVPDPFPEKDEEFSVRLAKPSSPELSGMFYNRIDIPRFSMTATILNGESKIA